MFRDKSQVARIKCQGQDEDNKGTRHGKLLGKEQGKARKGRTSLG